MAASVAATARTIDRLVDDVLARDPAGADWTAAAMTLLPNQQPMIGDPMGRLFNSAFGARAYSTIGNEVKKVNDLVAAAFKSAATAGEKKQFPDFHEIGLYDAV